MRTRPPPPAILRMQRRGGESTGRASRIGVQSTGLGARALGGASDSVIQRNWSGPAILASRVLRREPWKELAALRAWALGRASDAGNARNAPPVPLRASRMAEPGLARQRQTRIGNAKAWIFNGQRPAFSHMPSEQFLRYLHTFAAASSTPAGFAILGTRENEK